MTKRSSSSHDKSKTSEPVQSHQQGQTSPDEPGARWQFVAVLVIIAVGFVALVLKAVHAF